MKVFMYLKICLSKILSDIRAECNEYVINGVRYIVSSHFEETKITMKERFADCYTVPIVEVLYGSMSIILILTSSTLCVPITKEEEEPVRVHTMSGQILWNR